MTALLLHAVTGRGTAAADLDAVARAAHTDVRCRTTDDVVAWTSAVTDERDAALSHLRVIRELARRGPVVPVRAGTVVEQGEPGVDEWLADAAPRLARTLARLDGLDAWRLVVRFDEDAVVADVVTSDPTLRRRARRGRRGRTGTDVDLGEQVVAGIVHRGEVVHRLVVGAMDEVAEDVVDGSRREDDPLVVADLRLLVPSTERERLDATLEALAERLDAWTTFELVGPSHPVHAEAAA